MVCIAQCTQCNLTKKTHKQSRTKDNMLGWQAPHWNHDSCALDNPDGALDCQPIEYPVQKNTKSKLILSDLNLFHFPGTGMLNRRPFNSGDICTNHSAQAAGVKVIVVMQISTWNFRQDCSTGHYFLKKWKAWRLGMGMLKVTNQSINI